METDNSSAFSSRTLGGSRPGPPIGRLLPITFGQVSLTLPKHERPLMFSSFDIENYDIRI